MEVRVRARVRGGVKLRFRVEVRARVCVSSLVLSLAGPAPQVWTFPCLDIVGVRVRARVG